MGQRIRAESPPKTLSWPSDGGPAAIENRRRRPAPGRQKGSEPEVTAGRDAERPAIERGVRQGRMRQGVERLPAAPSSPLTASSSPLRKTLTRAWRRAGRLRLEDRV